MIQSRSDPSIMSRRHYSGVIEAVGDSVGLRGVERFSVSVAADGS